MNSYGNESFFDLFPIWGTVGWVALGLFALMVLLNLLFVVEQQTVAVIERFGRFRRVAGAGLRVKIPFIDRIVGRPSLRIEQLPVPVETITKDKVSIAIKVAVQYFVNPEKVYDAFYRLTDRDAQFKSFVFDVVRARVPAMGLDEVFEKKDEIADAVRDGLATTLDDFGFTIVKALVTDIEPDAKVKAAMNEINAAQRQQQAATSKGEADKVLRVKIAEAEAESKQLQGKGVANQAIEIAKGRKEAIELLQKALPGSTAHDVSMFVLMTQYFDTLREIAAHGKSNTIMLPHSPGGMSDIATQLREAVIVGEQISHHNGNGKAHD